MSAGNDCPFEIIRSTKEDDSAKKHKDRYVSFDIPLDPAQPDGLKATQEFKRLYSTEPEDVLQHLSAFDDAVVTIWLQVLVVNPSHGIQEAMWLHKNQCLSVCP